MFPHSHYPYPGDGEGGQADGQDDPRSHEADSWSCASGGQSRGVQGCEGALMDRDTQRMDMRGRRRRGAAFCSPPGPGKREKPVGGLWGK